MNDDFKKNEVSEEELSETTGGHAREISEDNDFLRSLGVISNQWDIFDFYFDSDYKNTNCVVKAWEKVGVKCVHKSVVGNEYYVNGKKVSRDYAYKYAKAYNGYGPLPNEFVQ